MMDGCGLGADEDWEGTVERVMQAAEVPGLSIAVVDQMGCVYSKGFGWSNLATATPALDTTRYRWFSMTKLVTATAALRLADRGDLDLDAPITEYLDEVPERCLVSTRQLLTHTSGLANPLPVRWIHSASATGPDQSQMLAKLLARRRMFVKLPGGRARYSNVGYLAAAEVIANVARASFTQHVREVILIPLGMRDTGFTDPGPDAATGYLNVAPAFYPLVRALLPGTVIGSRHSGVRALNPFLVDGAGYGGLVGSVADAARFMRLHLGDGELDGVRVLKADTARQMRAIVSHGRRFDHATGWFRDGSSGGRSESYVEHYGTGAGFWNVARVYPDRGLGVVVMTNGSRRFDIKTLMDHVLGSAAMPGAVPSECVSQLPRGHR